MPGKLLAQAGNQARNGCPTAGNDGIMLNVVWGKIAFYHARIPVDEGAGQSAKGDVFRVFHWSAPLLNVGDGIYRACDTPDHAIRPTFRAKYGGWSRSRGRASNYRPNDGLQQIEYICIAHAI